MITKAGLIGDQFTNTNYGGRCDLATSSLATLPASGLREAASATFTLTGNLVNHIRCSNYSSETKKSHYPHFFVDIEYHPTSIGRHSAEISIVHDADPSGVSSVTISGETTAH